MGRMTAAEDQAHFGGRPPLQDFSTQAVFELSILWQMQNALAFFHYGSLSRESLRTRSGNECICLARKRKETAVGGLSVLVEELAVFK